MFPQHRPRLWSLVLLCLFTAYPAVADDQPILIAGKGVDGVTRELDINRFPALYTGDFDDCLAGQSLFNVTNFDAAYYADNLTVLFHLDGTTNIAREDLILHISIDVYGVNRFNMTQDPCKAHISSMCPLAANVPVHALSVIPISATDVAGIPSIALGTPDLEGYARLRIFANSTQTEIGCFQAVMTNGNSFSQPRALGTVTGLLTLLAMAASFLTAAYGLSIPHMRMHYAHSFSVLVIVETFQSIFFSGALSVNWPSVLPAWWSNFAWSAGIFANERMIRSISSFTGTNTNISQVGGAGSVQIANEGGLSQQIYGRSLAASADFATVHGASVIRRATSLANDPYYYSWNGRPRIPGMPMPGTWPGFGGTLSMTSVPPAAAFMTAFIWLLVLLLAVTLFVVVSKFSLDILRKRRWMKTDGFDYFRSHLPGYLASALLRTAFIAFFAIMTLTMYQFSLRRPAGPVAIASLVWLLFLFGMGGIAAYACRSRLRQGHFQVAPDKIRLERGTLLKKVPFVVATRASQMGEDELARKRFLIHTFPFIRIQHTNHDPNCVPPHQDEGFIKRFGWLAARYRESRWWYFSLYLAYLFLRACLIGGGTRTPLFQVFSLFVFEILACLTILKLKPFEGNRNAAIAVWMLFVSKILTTAFSIAFLPDFNLSRVATTVIGIIIIVIQAFLAAAVLVLVGLGIVSTWMSLTRNRQHFLAPLEQTRIRYFEHIQTRTDLPIQKQQQPIEEKQVEEPAPSVFHVRGVRRAPKIEDEDAESEDCVPPDDVRYATVVSPVRRNRANSASSRCSASSIPRAARTHRVSWSSRDFGSWESEAKRRDSQRSLRLYGVSHESLAAASSAKRPPMSPMRESLEFAAGNPTITASRDGNGEAVQIPTDEGVNDPLDGKESKHVIADTQTFESPWCSKQEGPVSCKGIRPAVSALLSEAARVDDAENESLSSSILAPIIPFMGGHEQSLDMDSNTHPAGNSSPEVNSAEKIGDLNQAQVSDKETQNEVSTSIASLPSKTKDEVDEKLGPQ